MTNKLIADIIYYTHLLLIIYILFGFIFLPSNHLPFYIILIILVFIDWNDYDGMCILTKLEYYFRYGIWIETQEQIKNEKDQGYPVIDGRTSEEPAEFFRPLINKVFNVELTSEEATKLNYLLFSLCLLFGFIRYVAYCKNSRKRSI